MPAGTDPVHRGSTANARKKTPATPVFFCFSAITGIGLRADCQGA